MARASRTLIGLAALLGGGCSSPVPLGGVQLVMPVHPGDREVMYRSAQIKAIKVTIAGAKTYTQSFVPPTLSSNTFSFQADALPAGSYTAAVGAYADTAMTLFAGSATSSTFTITSGNRTTVTMPSLVLLATPTGAWTVTTNVTANNGYKVTGYQYALTEIDETAVATSNTSTGKTDVRTWQNVLAYPSGTSTMSLTVSGNKGNNNVTKSATSTASIASGATVSTAVSVTLP